MSSSSDSRQYSSPSPVSCGQARDALQPVCGDQIDIVKDVEAIQALRELE